MFLHLGCGWVALVMMRYRLSPRAQLPVSTLRLCSSTASLRQERPNFPDRFFFFEPALEVHPFIADKLRAALFVAFSASLQPLGFEIIALHRNFSPITFVYTLDTCAYM
jgi:hypothetical protein